MTDRLIQVSDIGVRIILRLRDYLNPNREDLFPSMVPARPYFRRACSLARLRPRSVATGCCGDGRLFRNSVRTVQVSGLYLSRRPRASHGILDRNTLTAPGWLDLRVSAVEGSVCPGPFS
jgi:hypothetical protein